MILISRIVMVNQIISSHRNLFLSTSSHSLNELICLIHSTQVAETEIHGSYQPNTHILLQLVNRNLFQRESVAIFHGEWRTLSLISITRDRKVIWVRRIEYLRNRKCRSIVGLVEGRVVYSQRCCKTWCGGKDSQQRNQKHLDIPMGGSISIESGCLGSIIYVKLDLD